MTISTIDAKRAQAAVARTKVLPNGDKIIPVQGGVYDLFSGEGWMNHIRFRIVKFRDKKMNPQLLQLSSGMALSHDYRITLLKELC
jgi:hypothetical protein